MSGRYYSLKSEDFKKRQYSYLKEFIVQDIRKTQYNYFIKLQLDNLSI